MIVQMALLRSGAVYLSTALKSVQSSSSRFFLLLSPEMTYPFLLKDSSSVLSGLSVTGVENHNLFANRALCTNW